MYNIKLVIFDLDGTLVDAYRAISVSFNYAMKKAGYPRQSDQVIRRAVGWGDVRLIGPFVSKGDVKKTLAFYRWHHQKSLLKHSKLMPGAKRLLGHLKKKRYLVAVASNRPTRFSRILISHLGLKNYFDHVLCADKLEFGKPHPAVLNNIREKFSFTPAEVLYVGDMTIDAQAGRRAGVRTAVVTGGSSTRDQIRKQKPWKILPGLAALQKIL